MIIKTTHNNILEKLEFDGIALQISKRENKFFEKTIDVMNGNEITINRYPAKVSAHWAKEWIKRRKIELSKSQDDFFNSLLEQERKIIELLECVIESNSKNYFCNTLIKAKGPTYYDLIELFTILNDNKLSISMKNSSFFYLFSADLCEKFEIHTKSKGIYQTGIPGLWFNESRNEVNITREFVRQFNAGVKKLTNA